MERSARPFLILFGVLVALLVCGGVALALAIHQGGMIEVDVHAKGPGGTDVTGLRVPGCLASLALHFVPDREFRVQAGELDRRGLTSESLRKVMDALAKIPDAVLIEVRDRDEHVRIAKEGRHLTVLADGDDEIVCVRVPIRLAAQLARKAAQG